MLPETFGRSLLFHLQSACGRAALEAECIFYGQPDDYSLQAALVRTQATDGNTRYHLFSAECSAERRGGISAHTAVFCGALVRLETSDGCKATIDAQGEVRTSLDHQPLNQCTEPWQVMYRDDNFGTLDD